MLCATIEDEPRFRELINGWIEEGSVPVFPAFVRETKAKRKARKRRHDEEAKEAQETLKDTGADPSEKLCQLCIVNCGESESDHSIRRVHLVIPVAL